MSTYRTDRNNNPVAFTTDIAKQAGLIEGTDYIQGEAFGSGVYHTAKLLGNPIEITIKVIDKIGFYTQLGAPRWIYICMPTFIWSALPIQLKIRTVQFMYHQEKGETLESLFQ